MSTESECNSAIGCVWTSGSCVEATGETCPVVEGVCTHTATFGATPEDATLLARYSESISGGAIDAWSPEWYSQAGGSSYTYASASDPLGYAWAADNTTFGSTCYNGIYSTAYGCAVDLSVTQWDPLTYSAVSSNDIEVCSNYGAPEIEYEMTDLAASSTYTVDVTVEDLNYYATTFNIVTFCSNGDATKTLADTVKVSCVDPATDALLMSVDVSANRTGDAADDTQSVTSFGLTCASDSEGRIKVRINQPFQFYRNVHTGDYVPYGRPYTGTTAIPWCYYSDGYEYVGTTTSKTLSTSPSTPCQLFTPSTQSGIWISEIKASTAQDCTGTSESTPVSRLPSTTATSTATSTATDTGTSTASATATTTVSTTGTTSATSTATSSATNTVSSTLGTTVTTTASATATSTVTSSVTSTGTSTLATTVTTTASTTASTTATTTVACSSGVDYEATLSESDSHLTITLCTDLPSTTKLVDVWLASRSTAAEMKKLTIEGGGYTWTDFIYYYSAIQSSVVDTSPDTTSIYSTAGELHIKNIRLVTATENDYAIYSRNTRVYLDTVHIEGYSGGAGETGGGALRIRGAEYPVGTGASAPSFKDVTVHNCCRGFRIQDSARFYCTGCHVENVTDNGLYFAAGSYTISDGCTDSTFVNSSVLNAGQCGILMIGGSGNSVVDTTVEHTRGGGACFYNSNGVNTLSGVTFTDANTAHTKSGWNGATDDFSGATVGVTIDCGSTSDCNSTVVLDGCTFNGGGVVGTTPELANAGNTGVSAATFADPSTWTSGAGVAPESRVTYAASANVVLAAGGSDNNYDPLQYASASCADGANTYQSCSLVDGMVAFTTPTTTGTTTTSVTTSPTTTTTGTTSVTTTTTPTTSATTTTSVTTSPTTTTATTSPTTTTTATTSVTTTTTVTTSATTTHAGCPVDRNDALGPIQIPFDTFNSNDCLAYVLNMINDRNASYYNPDFEPCRDPFQIYCGSTGAGSNYGYCLKMAAQISGHGWVSDCSTVLGSSRRRRNAGDDIGAAIVTSSNNLEIWRGPSSGFIDASTSTRTFQAAELYFNCDLKPAETVNGQTVSDGFVVADAYSSVLGFTYNGNHLILSQQDGSNLVDIPSGAVVGTLEFDSAYSGMNCQVVHEADVVNPDTGATETASSFISSDASSVVINFGDRSVVTHEVTGEVKGFGYAGAFTLDLTFDGPCDSYTLADGLAPTPNDSNSQVVINPASNTALLGELIVTLGCSGVAITGAALDNPGPTFPYQDNPKTLLITNVPNRCVEGICACDAVGGYPTFPAEDCVATDGVCKYLGTFDCVVDGNTCEPSSCEVSTTPTTSVTTSTTATTSLTTTTSPTTSATTTTTVTTSGTTTSTATTSPTTTTTTATTSGTTTTTATTSPTTTTTATTSPTTTTTVTTEALGCAPLTMSVSVQNLDGGNKYLLDGHRDVMKVGSNTYTFTDIPGPTSGYYSSSPGHPMKLVSTNSACQQAIDGSKSCNSVLTSDSTYCYGTASWTIGPECAGESINLYCSVHGAMGGTNRFVFDDTCAETTTTATTTMSTTTTITTTTTSTTTATTTTATTTMSTTATTTVTTSTTTATTTTPTTSMTTIYKNYGKPGYKNATKAQDYFAAMKKKTAKTIKSSDGASDIVIDATEVEKIEISAKQTFTSLDIDVAGTFTVKPKAVEGGGVEEIDDCVFEHLVNETKVILEADGYANVLVTCVNVDCDNIKVCPESSGTRRRRDDGVPEATLAAITNDNAEADDNGGGGGGSSSGDNDNDSGSGDVDLGVAIGVPLGVVALLLVVAGYNGYLDNLIPRGGGSRIVDETTPLFVEAGAHFAI
ncbi:MAG: right-handed parallel beta-helix repeat-containing protein [Limisphaerales bacterium]